MATDTGKPQSDHVAVSRMALSGGRSYEVITVSRAFLIAALEDARSWCHEVETPRGPGRTSGSVADYDAALAVIQEECAADTPARTLVLGIALESPQDKRSPAATRAEFKTARWRPGSALDWSLSTELRLRGLPGRASR